MELNVMFLIFLALFSSSLAKPLKPTLRERTETLFTWFEENKGVLSSSVELSWSAQNQRHLIAKEQIPAGAFLVSMPLSATLSDLNESVQKSFKDCHACPFLCSLFVFLHQKELKEESSLFPYINALSFRSRTFPEFFSPSTKELLKGSTFLQQLEVHREADKNVFKTFYRTFPQSKLDLRAFTVQFNQFVASSTQYSDGKTALLPMTDMLEIGQKSNVKWELDNQLFLLKSTAVIPAGKRLVLSSETKSNENLLLYYGLTLPSNSSLPEVNFVFNNRTFLLDESFRALRQILVGSQQERISSEEMLNRSESLAAALNEKISSYSMSYEEVVDELEASQDSSSRTSALRVLRDELYVLQAHLNETQTLSNQLRRINPSSLVKDSRPISRNSTVIQEIMEAVN